MFPFGKFPTADPILGPEMKSTGEVMGSGRSFAEAYAKAQLASGIRLPRRGTALLSVRDRDKPGVVKLAQVLLDRGFDLVATDGTAIKLAESGAAVRRVNKVREGRPHIVDMIKNRRNRLHRNTTEGKRAIRESQAIRAAAVNNKVTYYTALTAAMATSMALDHIDGSDVYKLQDLHAETAGLNRYPMTVLGAEKLGEELKRLKARIGRASSRRLPRRAATAISRKTRNTTRPRKNRASSRPESRISRASCRTPRSSTSPS